MPSWRDGLEGPALNVASATERVIRVAAGPGTGKSFTMKRRLARLITEDGVDPRRILAVTFTRTAAADLVQSIRALEVPGDDQITTGTLHGFCFRLLNRDVVFNVERRVPRPLVTFSSSGVLRFEAEPMLADLRDRRFGGKKDKTQRVLAFEADWARLQSDDPGWPPDATDRQFHGELIEWLRFHRAILIGELIPLALHYLRGNPQADELSAFDVVLVDEYQDLNRAEQVLIDILAGTGQLMVIGDEDQSIYSFRHANPEGIIQFLENHADARGLPLAECRRCPKRVVAMADSLIRHNHAGATVERLVPRADNPEGEVAIVQWPTLDDETRGLATYIKTLVESGRAQAGEILVLAPRRVIGYRIRDALLAAEIPVHSYFSEEAVEAVEAQRALTLLRLLAIPYDRVALRWWLGMGSPTWRSSEYARIRSAAEQENIEPVDLLYSVSRGERTMAGIRSTVAEFRRLDDELAQLRNLDVTELVARLLPEGASWSRAMREAALLHVEEEQNTTVASLVDAIVTSVTQPTMPQEGAFVRVMSLHKSKGLTAKAVVVAGCNAGLIPTIIEGRRARPVAAQEQEGRRLFYVACTRCTECLVLSSFARVPDDLAHSLGLAQGRRRGRQIDVQATPFLRQLGPSAPRAVGGAEWLEDQRQRDH